MKKVIFFILLMLSVLCGSEVFAENFYIDTYIVNAKVNKDKSVNIYEEITVYFTNPSHGIYRTIPLNNDEVSELQVSEKYSNHYSGREMTVKIGDADRLVSGEHKYRISYKLKIYDRLPEFYYNLIGTDWKVPIKYAAFQVAMPEDIDENKVGLSVGKYGTAGFDGEAVYYVKDNLIYGNTNRELSPHEGITLRIEVAEDYFDFVEDKRASKTILGLIILTFLSFVMWFSYGKDEHTTPVVSFNPPPDIDAADAELILKEKVSSNSLVAMLVQAAEKGYLQIETAGKKFTLYRKKNYDGNNPAEEDLLDALFDGKKHSVSEDDLKESKSFYKESRELIGTLNKRRKRFFTKSSLSWLNRFIMLLLMLGIAGLSIFALMNYRLQTEVFGCLIFYGFFALLFLAQRRSLQLLSNIGILLIITANMFPQLQYMISTCSPQNIKVAIFGGICFVIALICLIEFPKLNIYGQQIKGHLKGLKKFIEVAEKPRLEKMVEEDPKYFYKILPFAYILGVSDKWIKQFESIMIKPVEEFGSRPLTVSRFNNFTRSFGNTTLPSTQNGGISRSSGGGGFSGGGHGGGGGGSW